MNNLIRYEAIKFIKNPIKLWPLVISSLLIVFGISATAYSYDLNDLPTGEQFDSGVSYLLMSLANSYLFLPIWILIVIGYEFSSGHVSKVITLSGRLPYLKSKLLCIIFLSVLFTLLSITAYLLSYIFSGFTLQESGFGISKILQFFTVYLVNSSLFLAFILFVQSPIKSYGIYFGIGFLENIIALPIDRGLNIEPVFLPTHFMRWLYTVDGSTEMDKYFNPFLGDYLQIMISILVAVITLWLSGRYFLKNDLKILSD